MNSIWRIILLLVQSFQPTDQLKSQSWAVASQIAISVQEAQKRIKSNITPIQRSMQLYLANKETESILFRRIRNNVVGYFVQLEQILTNSGYTYDDILIVACPTPEQVSVFISSASLISTNEPVLPYGKKKQTTVIPKTSVTNTSFPVSLDLPANAHDQAVNIPDETTNIIRD